MSMRCKQENCFINKGPELVGNATEALFDEVRDLIDQCLDHRECFFIIEAPERGAYVQGIIDHEGFEIEAVSNTSLGIPAGTDFGLDAADHALLESLGWSAPDDEIPNWFRYLDAYAHQPAALASEILVRTLLEVYGAEPGGFKLKTGHCAEGTVRIPVPAVGS